ncbi:MAG: hypothetical protein JOZ07_10710 [Solirubrobacterales bacterium]|nr:hypothetical protein [Solirubrobacterales bacterium]
MRRWQLASLVALLSLVSEALIFATPHGPLRFAAASFIVVAAPGLAFVPILGLKDRELNAVLVIMFSLAVNVCVAQAVTYIKAFSWRPCALAVLSVTLIGVMIQLAQSTSLRRS